MLNRLKGKLEKVAEKEKEDRDREDLGRKSTDHERLDMDSRVVGVGAGDMRGAGTGTRKDNNQ